MRVSNMRIGVRLGAGFGVVCALLLLMVVVSNTMMARINAGTDEIVHDRMPKIEATTQLLVGINEIAIALRNMMLTEDSADHKAQVDHIMQTRELNQRAISMLDGSLKDPRARQLLAQMKTHIGRYRPGQDRLIGDVQANRLEAARAFLASDLRPILRDLKQATNALAARQQELSSHTADAAAATFEESRRLSWGLGALALALAAAIAYWISISITRPANRALGIARTVAAGDLTSQIDSDSSDEMGQLLLALKAMNDNLAATVGTVRSGTETIATAALQVASGSMDLSSRTEQQASSLEETASSMEELTSTTRQNAENARQANVLARSASDVAARGGQVIEQVTGTMNEINAASAKITDIISVIDGIAFQTNILALNAAVEAARAGEQGRGFAVVASEVRNLAQRSASAAREIKVLIDSSSTKVASGSALVNTAGDTMREIVSSVQRVTDIMAEMSSASSEQTDGIEQINQAVMQMDAVTQQNAALVEQSAAASEAMQVQAATLAQAVAVFRLRGDSGAVAPQSARPQPAAPRTAAPGKASVKAAIPLRRGAGTDTVKASKGAPAAKADEWEEF
ncbi:methyl-accepting chemotaxis protein [Janthinobacterium psychrotolerans]|uniref:Methyl-accepting chemotaxis protein n=1 Tax=Janthinobacterium psychrotolerans TaxID=1747903 RepID=A0A1A7C795_9BURK|nr:methyl-accepting chemotaxis protein [Janthinobacterium psychrotolerans]OBV41587.1 methyl-accepting chemotaxis protein [Janthinobacterium psychrotolerans]